MFTEASRRTIKEIGKYRIVRVGRDFSKQFNAQHAWDIQKKEQFLHLWCMPYVFARTDQKIKNRFEIMSDPFYFTKNRIPEDPLETKRCKIRMQKRIWLHRAPMAYRPNISNISMEYRMDRRILSIPGLSVNGWHKIHCNNMARKIKVSHHARFEAPRREESRQDLTSRWF